MTDENHPIDAGFVAAGAFRSHLNPLLNHYLAQVADAQTCERAIRLLEMGIPLCEPDAPVRYAFIQFTTSPAPMTDGRTLPIEQCAFAVTPAGVVVMQRTCEASAATTTVEPAAPLDSSSAVIPHWDPGHRELWFQGIVAKRFRKRGPNQECILAAFEEDQRPFRIDDPLPVKDDLVPSQRLREAIKRLNKGMKSGLLRFYGDGTGTGVCWKIMR